MADEPKSPATPPPALPAAPPPFDRRSRAFISFRRKSDFIWFALTFILFGFAMAVLIRDQIGREPVVVEREKIKIVEKRVRVPVPVPALPPVPVTAEDPIKVAVPSPRAAPAPAPKLKEKVWKIFKDAGVAATAQWQKLDGERVLGIDYDFTEGRWLVMGQEADPNFQSVRNIRFEYSGVGGKNTLEFKVEDAHGTNIGLRWSGVTDTGGEWRRMEFARSDLQYLWGGDSEDLDWAHIKLVDFGISAQETQGDTGGRGRLVIRRIQFL